MQHAYQWYGPNDIQLEITGATSQNLTVSNVLEGDEYYVNVTKPDFCDVIESKVIAFDHISIDTIMTTPSCEGLLDGTVAVVANLDSSPLNYIYQQGVQSADGTDAILIGPGTWNLTIEPTNSDCFSVDTTYTIIRDSLTFEYLNTETTCDDLEEGKVEVSASILTKNVEYNFTTRDSSTTQEKTVCFPRDL